MAEQQFKGTANVFTGMSTDLDPAHKFNSSRYLYAENALTSEGEYLGSLTNAHKLEVLNKIDFNYDLIAHRSSDKFTALVFRSGNDKLIACKYIDVDGNDELVKVATITGDFSKCTHLSVEMSIESDTIERLYIADGVNPIMALDIYRSGDINSWNKEYKSSDLSILKKHSSSTLIMPELISGALRTGKYYYIVKYVSSSGALSSVAGVSHAVNIKRDDNNGGYLNSDTGETTISPYGISLNISSIDTSINSIAVYRLYYSSLSSVPSLNLIYKNFTTGSSIRITDTEMSSVLSDDMHTDLVDQDEIIASVIERKDNMLIAGDIKYGTKGIADSIKYDTRAFQFDRGGSLVYKNHSGEEVSLLHCNSKSQLEEFLNGRDEDDFIFDDIYDNAWYRDVRHRYKLLEGPNGQFIPDGPERWNNFIYGGTGVNVEYEFCNSYLIAAEEGSRFDRAESMLYKNTQDSKYEYNEENLKWINILRDDLTVKYGDRDRQINNFLIRNQDGSIDKVRTEEFGIKPHKGKLDYSNSLIANTLAGYKRNEIYRFACKFTFEDGSSTDPMWIGDIRFPSNYIKRIDQDPEDLSFRSRYSFMSFETPEDLYDAVYNKTKGGAFSANPYPSLGEEGKIFRSELLVSPLGLKFRFNNLLELSNAGLKKIEILYSPMDYISRSIVGQFAVNRIGKFSNSGLANDIEQGIDEGDIIGKSYAHPTLSMKYLYGIGPMVMYAGDEPDNSRDSSSKTRASMSLGYDSYKEAIINTYVKAVNVGGQYFETQQSHFYSDATTVTSTSSPYFADYKNYLLISPETTYLGRSYFDLIKNSNVLVFENLIYPKATIPNVPNKRVHGGGSLGEYTSRKIPVVGGRTDQSYEADYRKRNPGLSSSMYSYTGLSMATIGIPERWSSPSVMFTGAMLDKSNEYSSEVDKSYIYLTLCGAINSYLVYDHSILYQPYWGVDRDSYININAFYENLYNNEVQPKRNVLYNVNPPSRNVPEEGFYGSNPGYFPLSIKTYMSGVGYMDIATNRINSNVDPGTLSWKSGFINNPNGHYPPGSTSNFRSERGRFIDENTNVKAFTDKYYLNASTFKYYKSSAIKEPEFSGHFDLSRSTVIPSVSFIWQVGNGYLDRSRTPARTKNDHQGYNPNSDYTTPSNGDYNTNSVFNIWDIKPIPISLDNFCGTILEPFAQFDSSQSIGSIDYINYSRTLSNSIAGILYRSNGLLNRDSMNLSVWDYPNDSKFNIMSDDNFRLSMAMYNRGRISGKHGAGILISTTGNTPIMGTIPAIGNINVKHKKTKLYIDSHQMSQHANILHRLDQAASTHNSTYLVDIRKQPSLKSIATYHDKKNSKYIRAAQTAMVIAKDQTGSESYIFGGDTYVTLFDYTNVYPTTITPGQSYSSSGPIWEQDVAWNTRYQLDQQTKINSLIPMESQINTHVDAGHSNHKDMNPWDTNEPGMLPVNHGLSSPAISRPSRELNEYIYDTSYSSKRSFDAIEMSYSYDDRFNDKKYKSRVIASEPKTYGEAIDSFTIFKPNNYIDLDPLSGPVTSLQTPLNRLYAFQPNSVYYLSVNDRSLITDDTGAQLILGVGGVLPYAQRLSSNYGLSSNTIGMIRKINDRVYFYDSKLNSICVLAEGITSLSESNGITTLTKMIGADNKSSIFPMYNNKHVVFSFNEIDTSKFISSGIGYGGKNLIFNVGNQIFESIFTENAIYGFDYNKKNLVIFESVRGKYGSPSFQKSGYISEPGSSGLNLVLGYISNPDFAATKVFDLAGINLSKTHSNSSDNSSFSISAKYSNSKQHTDIKNISSRSMNTEGNIEFAIPRSFDNTTGSSKARMRDKYLKSEYRFNTDGGEISLPLIRMAYRHSVL